MEYKIADSDFADLVEKKVNELISEGWKPIGGLCAQLTDRGDNFYQALIKE